MNKKYFEHIVHGGDYNPDQWLKTPEIIDEDMRLMKLANVNSATVGIFAWSAIEPREGEYHFEWLDTVLDKMAENGIDAILATPSGARPAWLAEKYPEVLRVNENGIRNEFGVRHNHCLTSPVYREKVREINRLLAERYKDHPAVKMWHISNEYSGECHCELCQQKFREWLKEYYHNDIEELNDAWWNSFWSHKLTDFSSINSPKDRGENHVVALKLCWKRFTSEQHISFLENEIAPLREITPDVPITTNYMRLYDGIDYQKMAEHLDIVSWDDYPYWDRGNNDYACCENAFNHDLFRSMKGGQPFFMMESTPSIVNWHNVNKIPKPGRTELAAMQAIAHGADSIQYFQWRKSRGSHEKFHGAVVDHCGHENTRVFREITKLGENISKLSELTGKGYSSKVAIVLDWENMWATKFFCGYNNLKREYAKKCISWYAPFFKNGIPADIIPMDADFSGYDLVIAPFLYMLKDGTEERIKNYVANGGTFVGTYLTGVVDKNDLCFLKGLPAGELKDVFGIWAEETDSLPEGMENSAEFGGKSYSVRDMCDIIHSTDAKVLGTYEKDFYAGEPAVTENEYGKGKAYYVAFVSDDDFNSALCKKLIEETGLKSDADFEIPAGVDVRRRGELLFILNFAHGETEISLDKEYEDVISGARVSGKTVIPECGYLILR